MSIQFRYIEPGTWQCTYCNAFFATYEAMRQHFCKMVALRHHAPAETYDEQQGLFV